MCFLCRVVAVTDLSLRLSIVYNVVSRLLLVSCEQIVEAKHATQSVSFLCSRQIPLVTVLTTAESAGADTLKPVGPRFVKGCDSGRQRFRGTELARDARAFVVARFHAVVLRVVQLVLSLSQWTTGPAFLK